MDIFRIQRRADADLVSDTGDYVDNVLQWYYPDGALTLCQSCTNCGECIMLSSSVYQRASISFSPMAQLLLGTLIPAASIILVVVLLVVYRKKIRAQHEKRMEKIQKKQKKRKEKANKSEIELEQVITEARTIANDGGQIPEVVPSQPVASPSTSGDRVFVCYNCAERVTILAEKAIANTKVYCSYCGSQNVL